MCSLDEAVQICPPDSPEGVCKGGTTPERKNRQAVGAGLVAFGCVSIGKS
jgi:hypothetical protein